MKKYRLSVVLLSVVLSSTVSFGATLDFSDLTSGNCQTLGASVHSEGYTFTQEGGVNQLLFLCNPGVLQNNTAPAMLNANFVSTILMNPTVGGVFSLQSFSAGARTGDFSPGTPSAEGASGIDVLGTLANSSTVDAQFTFETATSFDLLTLPDTFTDLTSVEFTALGTPANNGLGPMFLFNNITVNAAAAAPEPAGLFMMAAGLTGLVLLRQRLTGV